jgi:hypothetical protein
MVFVRLFVSGLAVSAMPRQKKLVGEKRDGLFALRTMLLMSTSMNLRLAAPE